MDQNKITSSALIISTAINLIVFIPAIIYLLKLEDKSCNCIRDWRHNYMKVFCILIILFQLLQIILLMVNKQQINNNIIMIINILLYLIYIYSFITYIGDLNTTKCKCAVDKQPYTNMYMKILRYVYIISVIMICLNIFIKILPIFITSMNK